MHALRGVAAVVQDALELAEVYPDNPVHKLLLEQPKFKSVHQQLLGRRWIGLGIARQNSRCGCHMDCAHTVKACLDLSFGLAGS
jgi:hypothetical protein